MILCDTWCRGRRGVKHFGSRLRASLIFLGAKTATTTSGFVHRNAIPSISDFGNVSRRTSVLGLSLLLITIFWSSRHCTLAIPSTEEHDGVITGVFSMY